MHRCETLSAWHCLRFPKPLDEVDVDKLHRRLVDSLGKNIAVNKSELRWCHWPELHDYRRSKLAKGIKRVSTGPFIAVDEVLGPKGVSVGHAGARIEDSHLYDAVFNDQN